MSLPPLSICIPTYKRLEFLEWTLERTNRDFPDARIIVSNNNHGDHVNDWFVEWCARGAQYIGQPENIGPFPNLAAVLLAADTKYCCYLGDDDYLLPDEVQKGIDFLEANPDVVAYYAPCQLWDEVNQKSVFEAFYNPGGPSTFESSPHGKVSLFNFVCARHVWPEHAIYRRSALEKILASRSPNAYWCFTDLANAINAGPVHFHDKPYYRNITAHPVGDRQKLGDQQCLTEFDLYRAGLEVMAFELFVGLEIPNEQYHSISKMIQQFIWLRLEVAARLYGAQGRVTEAMVLHKRCAVTKI